MSFAIKIVGKPADVAAAVRRDIYIPEPLKDTVDIYATAIGSQPGNAMLVEANGHYDGISDLSTANLKIEKITLVAPPIVDTVKEDPAPQSGTTAA